MSVDRQFRMRARTSNVGTVIGITLVLVMLGTLGYLLLNARKIERYLKDRVQVDIYLKRETQEMAIMRMTKKLEQEPFTRSVNYVTPDSAAARLENKLGKDFLGPLTENTLQPSIELKVTEVYAHPDSLKWIAEHVRQMPNVDKIFYNATTVENMHANMNRLRLALAGFSGLLLIIAVALINNTIRLAIYSKRFLIRTMYLVGATGWFIKKPFLAGSLWQGIVASVLAIGLLAGLIQVLMRYMPDLRDPTDALMLALIFGGVVFLGLVISLLSTWFAVRRYLRMNTDELNWS
jgi:cell division transport system permease protein